MYYEKTKKSHAISSVINKIRQSIYNLNEESIYASEIYNYNVTPRRNKTKLVCASSLPVVRVALRSAVSYPFQFAGWHLKLIDPRDSFSPLHEREKKTEALARFE